MTDKIKETIRDIGKQPVKIVFSTIFMVFMLILSFFAWDGIPKRMIICLGLTLLSGILLLLPKLTNRISVPLLVLFLFYVPRKIFQRMELPVQDMSRIMDGVEELTIAFIICAFLLIFLVTQSSAAALGAGSVFFLLLFLVEYYLWRFREDFLMPSDLRAVGTAISVMKNYDYRLSPEALYSVIYLLFFAVLGFKIRIHMHKWVHVGVSAIAVLLIGGWYYTVMDTPNPLGKEFVINYWVLGDTRNLNGACLSYFLLLKDSQMEIPEHYSEKELRKIADGIAGNDEKLWETGQKPNIIMIMNEAWSDLRVLGELDTTQECMSYVEGLKENTIRGNLYVNILGGLTANTEFESLTGDSLALLAAGVIPFQNQVRHDMPSLARTLKAQGYKAMAVHPNGEGTWSRNRVYRYFGFDEFIHQGNWEVPYEYVGGFISDACNFKEVIQRYEERDKEAPFFLFNVTIQNHGGYQYDTPLDIGVLKVGETSAEEMGDITELQKYMNLINITDEAFGTLIEYFKQVEEPVIICMYGDHQPLLNEDFYDTIFAGQELSEQEQNLRKYIVPYIIWANYEVDWEEYGNMSANYLPAVLMECAGLGLPPYYQFLLGMHEEYPVLTQKGCLDKDGNLIDIKNIWEEDLIYQYRMLQYNQLYVKDYLGEIFGEMENEN